MYNDFKKALCLLTNDQHWLISVFSGGKTHYFYMDFAGNYRPVKREKERGLPLTPQEWAWAKTNWGVPVEEVSSIEKLKLVAQCLTQREAWLWIKNEENEGLDNPQKNATYTLKDVIGAGGAAHTEMVGE